MLVLANPGLGLDNMQATPSIYLGLQLILPQETRPTIATARAPCASSWKARRLHHRRGRAPADGAGRPDPDALGPLARARTSRQRAGGLAGCAGPAARCTGSKPPYATEGLRQVQRNEPGFLADALSSLGPHPVSIASPRRAAIIRCCASRGRKCAPRSPISRR